jgi:hypothetical protein
MAGEAIFIGWGNATRGSESKALQVFGEAVELWGKLQEDGKLESWEPVFLSPHGGDLNGFFLLRGDGAALDEVRRSDAFLRVVTRAGLVVDNFGAVNAYCGEGIQTPMSLYQEASGQLGG